MRQEAIETSQLAVDTHGYADFAMALARPLGFDLCPRLKELKRSHLYRAQRFETLRYASEILPSQAEAKTGTND